MPNMRLASFMLATVLVLAGCAMPRLGAPAAAAPSGTILFKDDFASPASGWDRAKYEEGITDYDGGGYRMLISALDLNFWSTPHKDFADARIEVDAGKLGGPDENRIGLICRLSGNDYYFFAMSSDGYYGLGLFKGGVASLLGQKEMQRSDSIHTGLAINHLRLDCKGGALTAFVNGFQVANVQDTTLQHGDVGLLGGTFKKPGADIVFDNFVVFAP